MQLSELIKTYKQEKDQWPASPNVLLDFCQYKFNIGELEEKEYRLLYAKLHTKGDASTYQVH